MHVCSVKIDAEQVTPLSWPTVLDGKLTTASTRAHVRIMCGLQERRSRILLCSAAAPQLQLHRCSIQSALIPDAMFAARLILGCVAHIGGDGSVGTGRRPIAAPDSRSQVPGTGPGMCASFSPGQSRSLSCVKPRRSPGLSVAELR